ncbi:hypothetical protein [Xenorhabdus hominickii]|uniref:Uncharacterized protein n=1 Tax=Xenorhabdus hominickii TaxID=351679 RepID=A0A2G0Q865_XENHO|nr:hypothetical protein [Xenorhabdus hominickii]AOM41325.1 hypothetical protein A9255_12485 [Xenorhabdus hominickii]PHM55408.1 hypothetical protein Xhom_02146 [Xenorhabdus hominickii]PHM57227.1 hypothetical protein Xhom_00189 [Xenorhabdus hominickii]
METLIKTMNNHLTKLKEELLSTAELDEKINNGSFGDTVLSWSKSRAYGVIPFYSELTGYSSDSMLKREPKNKKNAYCYIGNGNIDKIIRYNTRSEIEDIEYIIRTNNEVFSILKDFRGDFRSLTKLILDDQGKNQECYRVDDDGDFFGYHYIYNDDVISEIISMTHYNINACNSIYLEYDDTKNLEGIYFKNKGEKVYIYSINKR